jgi:hypothetical protein
LVHLVYDLTEIDNPPYEEQESHGETGLGLVYPSLSIFEKVDEVRLLLGTELEIAYLGL